MPLPVTAANVSGNSVTTSKRITSPPPRRLRSADSAGRPSSHPRSLTHTRVGPVVAPSATREYPGRRAQRETRPSALPFKIVPRAAPPCPRAARPGRSSASRAPCRRAEPRAPRAPWGRRNPRAPRTFRTPHAANRPPPSDRKAACWRRLAAVESPPWEMLRGPRKGADYTGEIRPLGRICATVIITMHHPHATDEVIDLIASIEIQRQEMESRNGLEQSRNFALSRPQDAPARQQPPANLQALNQAHRRVPE